MRRENKMSDESFTFIFEVTLTGYEEPIRIFPQIDWSQVDFVR